MSSVIVAAREIMYLAGHIRACVSTLKNHGLCFRLLARTVAKAQPINAMGGSAPTIVARINVSAPARTFNRKASGAIPAFPNSSVALNEIFNVRPNLSPGSGAVKGRPQLPSVALKAIGNVKRPEEFLTDAMTTPDTSGVKVVPLG